MSKVGVEGKPRRSNVWVRLRKRLNRKGVVEVDVDHLRYKMLNILRQGIQDLLLNHQELGPKRELTPEDYKHVHVKEFISKSGKKFTFMSHSSAVFASLRQAVSVSEDHYLSAIAPEDLPYMEFMSNSRSGQDFYLSNDQEYILKTDKQHNIDIFKSFLLQYLDHFHIHPHSLIVKFLGVYTIEGPGCPKTNFLAMQNIFYPPQRIESKFDLKGCLKNRYQKPNPPGSNYMTIYKDVNFLEENIDLGIQKSWFLRQLQIDVEFLRQIGVQDYSLLIGRHRITSLEIKESVGDVFIRIKKSYGTPNTQALNPEPHNPLHNENLLKQPASSTENIAMNKIGQSNSRTKYTVPEFLTDSGSAEFKQSNRRLLLTCRNTLHVINGAEYRYYFGIVDFFTMYECRQRMGRLLKTVKYFSTNHSTVPPDEYAERFLKFISERTM